MVFKLFISGWQAWPPFVAVGIILIPTFFADELRCASTLSSGKSQKRVILIGLEEHYICCNDFWYKKFIFACRREIWMSKL